ncbi:MAG TPA: CDP-alcohol phosphatidyltransferase family protein [Gaiellaceae bacterium]|jgi:CDP-diacylglycerol--glycerol-3-phosphate 3-phosphatidyltransferase|nr:CDP-alcohol phosphatidyltransferase family protein [Gaiellaceae bacterium]
MWRQHVPNALTILRFAAIPLFAWLYAGAGDGPAWGAGALFGLAAATDQLDGFLARRWHVESAFGKVADPLADRLMIGVAVVLLWVDGRLPWPAAVLVLARDLLLVAGYKLVVPRGYAFDVSLLGKVATWILYFSLACVIVTEKGTDWPLWLFWLGVALALAAGTQYVLKARREVGTAARQGDAPPPRRGDGQASS